MCQSKTQFESLLDWRYIAFYHEGCVGVGCNSPPGVGCNSIQSITVCPPGVVLKHPCFSKAFIGLHNIVLHNLQSLYLKPIDLVYKPLKLKENRLAVIGQ